MMALLIYGMKCRICDQPKLEGQEFQCFPPFVDNPHDALFFFTDACFHQACFDAHPLASAALQRYEKLLQLFSRKACTVCAKAITEPDDYFALGYYTDDETSVLYPYNGLQFHKSCLSRWRQLSEAYEVLKAFYLSDQWEGSTRILDDLETMLKARE